MLDTHDRRARHRRHDARHAATSTSPTTPTRPSRASASRRRCSSSSMAWTEPQPFGWQGRYYEYRSISIWPRPVQKPHPPIYMSGSSPELAEFAAPPKRCSAWPSPSPRCRAAEAAQRYREQAARRLAAAADDCSIGWLSTSPTATRRRATTLPTAPAAAARQPGESQPPARGRDVDHRLLRRRCARPAQPCARRLRARPAHRGRPAPDRQPGFGREADRTHRRSAQSRCRSMSSRLFELGERTLKSIRLFGEKVLPRTAISEPRRHCAAARCTFECCRRASAGQQRHYCVRLRERSDASMLRQAHCMFRTSSTGLPSISRACTSRSSAALSRRHLNPCSSDRLRRPPKRHLGRDRYPGSEGITAAPTVPSNELTDGKHKPPAQRGSLYSSPIRPNPAQILHPSLCGRIGVLVTSVVRNAFSP